MTACLAGSVIRAYDSWSWGCKFKTHIGHGAWLKKMTISYGIFIISGLFIRSFKFYKQIKTSPMEDAQFADTL